MSKKMGRPQKVSTEDKITIIDQYYISRTGETSGAIGTHGIFRKLAIFSKEIGYELEDYDFSRDDAVRAHIAKLSAIKDTTTYDSALPTFSPLDLTALMNKSKQRVEDTLRDREEYFQSLHIKASHAIESNKMLSQKIHCLQNDLRSLEEKNQQLEAESKATLRKLRGAESEISYLKRIIRRDIEPERAQQFLAGLISQEVAIQVTQKSVMTNISSLTQEDRNMRKEAERDLEKADLNGLLQLI